MQRVDKSQSYLDRQPQRWAQSTTFEDSVKLILRGRDDVVKTTISTKLLKLS